MNASPSASSPAIGAARSSAWASQTLRPALVVGRVRRQRADQRPLPALGPQVGVDQQGRVGTRERQQPPELVRDGEGGTRWRPARRPPRAGWCTNSTSASLPYDISRTAEPAHRDHGDVASAAARAARPRSARVRGDQAALRAWPRATSAERLSRRRRRRSARRCRRPRPGTARAAGAPAPPRSPRLGVGMPVGRDGRLARPAPRPRAAAGRRRGRAGRSPPARASAGRTAYRLVASSWASRSAAAPSSRSIRRYQWRRAERVAELAERRAGRSPGPARRRTSRAWPAAARAGSRPAARRPTSAPPDAAGPRPGRRSRGPRAARARHRS